MAIELDHSFSTAKSIDESYATILDLDGRSNYPQVLERALSTAREAIANRR